MAPAEWPAFREDQNMKSDRVNMCLTAAMVAMAVAGCASPGYKEGDSAAGAMRAAAAEAATVQTSVDATVTALKDLLSSTDVDLRPKYEAFSTNLDRVQGSVAALQRRTDSMTTAATNHLKRWEEDMKKVTSEELRKKSLQRRAEVEERVRKVKELSEQTRVTASPALADLEDIRRVIGTDLTAGGIATIRDAAERAQTSAAALKESATKLTAELDGLAGDIASKPPPPPPPPPAAPAASTNTPKAEPTK
jgi:hypothetical protein